MEAVSREGPPSRRLDNALNVDPLKGKQSNVNQTSVNQGTAEKPKSSLFSKAKNVVLAGLGIATVGAATEAVAHPVETTVEGVTNAVITSAENIKQAGEGLVDFHNEDPAIQQKNEEIAGKLNGTIPLAEGEKIYEKITLVPAGATFEERQKMEQEGTPINVRNYPGTNTPDGRFSSIITELPQGTIIEHAILTKGNVPHPPTADDTADWWSFVVPNKDPNQPGEIGYVFGIYGEPNVAASSTSTPPVLE